MKYALLAVAPYWLWLAALVPLRLHQVAACSGRSMMNATSGVITDGAGNYPASANCEWLIDGKLFTAYFSFYQRKAAGTKLRGKFCQHTQVHNIKRYELN